MTVFITSYYVLAIVLFLMAVVFFFVPLPKDEGLRNYKISLRLFSLSYAALTVYCLIKLHYKPQLLSIPFLVAAPSQAVLLTLSHINLVNPRRVTKARAIKNLIPLIVFILLEVVQYTVAGHVEMRNYHTLLFWDNGYMLGELTDVLLREAWFIVYFATCIYYGIAYFREEKEYKVLAGNYSSENEIVNMPVARASFICALCVGVTTIFITLSLNEYMCTVLNYMIMAFYIAMALLYLQYPKMFLEISTFIFENSAPKEDDAAEQPNDSEWLTIRNAIVQEGLYKQQGITVEDIAHHFAKNRTYISNMVNTNEKENFNTFINKLRIAESERLMKQNPDMTFAEIAEMVGYSEQSNFTRQFRQITGNSPSAFRKKISPENL
ncbi:MAG: helix-turn-helix transcriptional regulator [Bacteroidales bacterium]|nr:helix-turn-helix transcriptional regulator [Bacteroidales bacterium]MBR6265690.1 helix-turn-helix transcriptional regulator [Bacteroidales bacterium]